MGQAGNRVSYEYRSIKQIPRELRPREKLLKHGAQTLSDEELLAVVLGSGTRGTDVLKLSKELISMGWDKLEKLKVEELLKVKGLGLVKALQIKALLELSRRINRAKRGTFIRNPKEALDFLIDKFNERKESLIALYLDLSNRLLDYETVAVGNVNTVFAKPKDILFKAVKLSANGIIVAHNHPQGDAKPSEEDLNFTQRLKKACELLGFELLDHIIVAPGNYFSFREEGLL
ncbi:MAG: JAB domain-containing protein [Aquificae bacterium]|nr:JAB domain-containing protein [Aquificota bacterium]